MFSNRKESYRAAVYIRLSKDDGDKLESNSVANQRAFIASFLAKKPDIVICSERIDDGYSGVSFDRPAVKAMLEDIKAGTIDCVVVKDLSRFGRNYIEAGRYIEQVFPFLDVRFIAINDGYDSASQHSQTDSMLIPFKNLINDAYSRDISMKVRSGIATRCKQGDYIGAFPLYGYFRSKEDKHRLEVDEFAAMTVRDIFKWKLSGMSNQRIADRLNTMGILSPLEYKNLLGWKFSTSFKLQPVAAWSAAAVARILRNAMYTGTMIQGKESTPNYKIKKRFRKPPSAWIVVENTHEAIVEKADFDLVQRLMCADTRTAPESEQLYLFSGLLTCGNCNHSMIRKPVKSHGRTYIYYVCRTQKTDKSKCDSPCRIAEANLTQGILSVLQIHVRMIDTEQHRLVAMDALCSKQTELQKVDLRIQSKREEHAYCQARVLDLYEDYKKGIVSKENYIAWKGIYEENGRQMAMALDILKEEKSVLLKSRQQRDACGQQLAFSELTRLALATMVERIVVVDKNTLQVHFTFQSELVDVLERAEAGAKERMRT